MSFVATRNKGFAMTFNNGFTISVHKRWDSLSAEIAVFDNEGMISIGDTDEVLGWCSAEDVAKYIAIVSSAKDANEIIENIK